MKRGSVRRLLGVAVECPALDRFRAEAGRPPEARIQPGLTGDHAKECHLHARDWVGGHQGLVGLLEITEFSLAGLQEFARGKRAKNHAHRKN